MYTGSTTFTKLVRVLDSTDVKLFLKDCFCYKHTVIPVIFPLADGSKQTQHAHLICMASAHCLSFMMYREIPEPSKEPLKR
jgi:hypothetical protein